MINLDNKVAIIPGGATLIGRKVALEFIRAGARVTVCDIDEAGGSELEIEAGDRLKFIRADITDDLQIDAVINQTVETWGGIDCLVNVACTYLDNGMDSTRAEWQQALDINLVSGAVFVQKVVPHLRKRGGGAIVNFGSISGKRAQPGRLLYAASKAAIIGATRNEALLLAEENIRVNSVSPGWTWSNVIRDMGVPLAVPPETTGQKQTGLPEIFICPAVPLTRKKSPGVWYFYAPMPRPALPALIFPLIAVTRQSAQNRRPIKYRS